MNDTDDFKSFSADWMRILDQDEFWVTASGSRTRVEDMEVSHCANAYAFVLRRLPLLAAKEVEQMLSGPGPSGDMACDAFDGELARLEHIAFDPASFVAQSPLMQALERRSRGFKSPDPDRERAVAYEWVRVPQNVQAVRFTGDNHQEIIDLVGPLYRVEDTHVSGPGPCRGMQKAVQVWSVNSSADVPVGSWLVIDGEKLSSMTDAEFTGEYARKQVPASREICWCGREIETGENHSMCYPGME